MKQIQHGLTIEQFTRVFESLLTEQYEYDSGGPDFCLECGGGLQTGTAFVSIHDLEFGDHCAGSGQVVRLGIPYCPRCEPNSADMTTCVHVPISERDRVSMLLGVLSLGDPE